MRKTKRNLEKDLAKDKSTNSNPFYAHLTGKTKSRTAVGPLQDKDKTRKVVMKVWLES